jgi:hypothetical protein
MCNYKSKMEPIRESPFVLSDKMVGAISSALGPGYMLDFFFFFKAKKCAFTFVGAEERNKASCCLAHGSLRCIEREGPPELCLCTGS